MTDLRNRELERARAQGDLNALDQLDREATRAGTVHPERVTAYSRLAEALTRRAITHPECINLGEFLDTHLPLEKRWLIVHLNGEPMSGEDYSVAVLNGCMLLMLGPGRAGDHLGVYYVLSSENDPNNERFLHWAYTYPPEPWHAPGPHPNRVAVTCDVCDGEGGDEDVDGPSAWLSCSACDGNGVIYQATIEEDIACDSATV